MVSKKRLIWIMVALLTLSLILVTACSQNKSEEKIAGKALKLATGKDVDVKIQGDKAQKVQIEQKGSKTEMAETTVWPAEIIKDVPQFTAGKIQRVVKTNRQRLAGQVVMA